MTTPYTPQTIPVGLGSDREAGPSTPAPKSAPLGVPLLPACPPPIERVDDHTPGYGWRLSDAARRDIEAIKANARRAMRMLGGYL